MPIVVQLRHEMFTQPASQARLAATAAIHEVVLVGLRHVLPVDGMSRLRGVLAPRSMIVLLVEGDMTPIERALVEELLNDGIIPVVLSGCGVPSGALTGWLGTICQDASSQLI
jgi:hypothetical protein